MALPVSRPRATGLLEARIPGLSEPVSAIALGGFRALVRSPEAKMMLLSPIIMIPIFGSMLWRGRAGIPEVLRPLVAIGGMVLVLFGVVQLMGNQFGFDRDGFRVFILSPATRRHSAQEKLGVCIPWFWSLPQSCWCLCRYSARWVLITSSG